MYSNMHPTEPEHLYCKVLIQTVKMCHFCHYTDTRLFKFHVDFLIVILIEEIFKLQLNCLVSP